MNLYQMTTPGLAINTYILVDSSAKKGVVIDATRDVSPLLEVLQRDGLQEVAILETHVHADFVSGARELKHILKRNDINTQIYSSGMGGPTWIPNYADHLVKDKQELVFGEIKLQAWHTPGHTPEHVMWLLLDKDNVPRKAFTGDFLLFGSLGRPDLLGEKTLSLLSNQLYNSVFNTLAKLPDAVEIYPAHGAGSLCGKGISPQASSTLGEQRKNNPFLILKPKEEWIRSVLSNMPPAPRYFSIVKQMNLSGVTLIEELPPLKEFSPLDILAQDPKEVFFLDVRNKEDFSSNHLAGSINIPFSPLFLSWAAQMVSYEKSILMISPDEETLGELIKNLRTIGLDNLKGFFVFTPEKMQKIQENLVSSPWPSFTRTFCKQSQHLRCPDWFRPHRC